MVTLQAIFLPPEEQMAIPLYTSNPAAARVQSGPDPGSLLQPAARETVVPRSKERELPHNALRPMVA
jgi:hypothetical protein